ncbi:hypothetical protein PR048_019903 [Dryococelus australis]|uniref:HTH CENPB-type domain-containing protein n=1 Tax=Dryococelus australis TaxID=614101 RepID=A0ABQ9H4X4_9NEOP|nr:hypothetical protein PR048_019903 [Dryococelus australis]
MVLQIRAWEIVTMQGVIREYFKASRGWISLFMHHKGLTAQAIYLSEITRRLHGQNILHSSTGRKMCTKCAVTTNGKDKL